MQPADIGRLVTVADPKVSPDGCRVAFVVTRVDLEANRYRSTVWLAAADGSSLPYPLTSGEHGDGQPAWSPDGRRLAFQGTDQCEPSVPCSYLYTVRRNGTGLHRVTDRGAAVPAWSSTGTIAFRGGAADVLFGVRPNGSRLRRLLAPPDQGSYDPDWSPDGSQLVFAAPAHEFGDTQHIFTARADGSRLSRLTDLEGRGGTSPVWSPDGRYIAFIRNGEDLYVMRSNGRRERRIVNVGMDPDFPSAPYTELSAPAWQPLPR